MSKQAGINDGVWLNDLTTLLIGTSLLVKEEHEMLEETNDDEPIKAKKRK